MCLCSWLVIPVLLGEQCGFDSKPEINQTEQSYIQLLVEQQKYVCSTQLLIQFVSPKK